MKILNPTSGQGHVLSGHRRRPLAVQPGGDPLARPPQVHTRRGRQDCRQGEVAFLDF